MAKVQVETAGAQTRDPRTFFKRYAFLLLSVTLFAVSLGNDGYYIAGPNPRAWAPAIGLLAVGWLGIFSGTVAWLANPALFIAWFMSWSRRNRGAAAFALLAAALVLSFQMNKTVIKDENGGLAKITGYGPGYWLWLASTLTLLVGAILESLFQRDPPRP